jgi:hypothetical protein
LTQRQLQQRQQLEQTRQAAAAASPSQPRMASPPPGAAGTHPVHTQVAQAVSSSAPAAFRAASPSSGPAQPPGTSPVQGSNPAPANSRPAVPLDHDLDLLHLVDEPEAQGQVGELLPAAWQEEEQHQHPAAATAGLPAEQQSQPQAPGPPQSLGMQAVLGSRGLSGVVHVQGGSSSPVHPGQQQRSGSGSNSPVPRLDT